MVLIVIEWGDDVMAVMVVVTVVVLGGDGGADRDSMWG